MNKMQINKVILMIFSVLSVCCAYNGNSGYQFYQHEKTYDTGFPDRNKHRNSDNSELSQKFGREWLCFALGICAAAGFPFPPAAAQKDKLNLAFQWYQLEYDYASPSERENDIQSGQFTPSQIAPIDVDVYYSKGNEPSQIFITVPRFIPGIPATLGTVTNKKLNGSPIIKPYPSWSWHRNSAECHRDRLVSVFRTKADECGRLWVLDTGNIGSKKICPPQILAFDLKTNQLIHRHEFTPEEVSSEYLLVTPEIDIRDPQGLCQDTFVYIADVLGFALIVYDAANDRTWRIQDKTFYPFPTYGTFHIAGESFELMDGLLGLALSPYRKGEDRVLFYHAMSSPTENWVYTSVLRNQTLFKENPACCPQHFHTYKNQRRSQVAAEAIDKNGIAFFGLLTDVNMVCWNTQTEYGPRNFDVIADNPTTLQFPSGVKVITNQAGEQELWIMTSRFQKIANGSLNTDEPNFRIQYAKISDLTAGTRCRGKQFHHNQIGGGGYGFYGGKK